MHSNERALRMPDGRAYVNLIKNLARTSRAKVFIEQRWAALAVPAAMTVRTTVLVPAAAVTDLDELIAGFYGALERCSGHCLCAKGDECERGSDGCE
jgi:hypothetical protein